MTENVQLEQSVSEWKDEALGDSFFPPQSLEVITFIVSAGVFGAVLAYSASRISDACCFPSPLPGILPVAVGGAAGAAIGAAKGGPIGGIAGALLGTFLCMVVVFPDVALTLLVFVFFALGLGSGVLN